MDDNNGYPFILMLIIHYYLNSGWWYTYPSEKYDFISCSPEPEYVCNIAMGFSHGPNRNRWFTVHKNGDFPWLC